MSGCSAAYTAAAPVPFRSAPWWAGRWGLFSFFHLFAVLLDKRLKLLPRGDELVRPLFKGRPFFLDLRVGFGDHGAGLSLSGGTQNGLPLLFCLVQLFCNGGVRGLDGEKVLIGCRLCRFENAVDADGGLGDGTGAGDAELFFLQLALELFDLRGGGVVLLLQLINDIDQVKTAEMPQLFVRHFFLVLQTECTR